MNKWKKGLTLVLVEGIDDKDPFLKSICHTFPELNIDYEADVFTFNTNLGKLYKDLVEEYGSDFVDLDVDLPVLLSRKYSQLAGLRKTNFKNILLFFDYDCHDPQFTEEKIQKLQALFSDPSDNGQLYINYPMLESYCDCVLDEKDKFMSSMIEPKELTGKIYKPRAKKASNIYGIFKSENGLDFLKEKLDSNIFLKMPYSKNKNHCLEKIRNHVKAECPDYTQKDVNAIVGEIYSHLFNENMKYKENEKFLELRKRTIQKLVSYHLEKALVTVQHQSVQEEIDLQKILSIQTKFLNEKNKIYILNTSILFVADYNPKLIEYSD